MEVLVGASSPNARRDEHDAHSARRARARCSKIADAIAHLNLQHERHNYDGFDFAATLYQVTLGGPESVFDQLPPRARDRATARWCSFFGSTWSAKGIGVGSGYVQVL